MESKLRKTDYVAYYMTKCRFGCEPNRRVLTDGKDYYIRGNGELLNVNSAIEHKCYANRPLKKKGRGK